MRSSFRALGLAALWSTAVAVTIACPRAAVAQSAPQTAPPPGPPTSAADHAAAEVHFTKARELYQSGSYREAATELEAALALDPNAKDLVFNLGVVDERLGRIDDALTQFHRYEAMDLTSAEHARAEAYIRRLEGVKRAATPAPMPTPRVEPVHPPPPKDTAVPPPASSAHGRVDAATVTSLAVGGAGIVVGTIFGIDAAVSKPSHYATGSEHSYDDYLSARSSFKTDGTVSTVAFSVGIAAVAASAILFFARTKEAGEASPGGESGSSAAAVVKIAEPFVSGIRF